MFFPYLPLGLTTSAGRQKVYQSVEPYAFGETLNGCSAMKQDAKAVCLIN